MAVLAYPQIKKIQQALHEIFTSFEKTYHLQQHQPFRTVKEYCLRPSKNVRALLLLLSYCGYAHCTPSKKTYTWAASLEIIQDFVLIHDDLIDHASVRRGGRALHQQLGNNVALVYGDILFALGLKTFLSISANPKHKEKALHVLFDSAIITGLGETTDILNTKLNTSTRAAIYTMYDQKTAHYSFITPLVAGALLAGKDKSEITKLYTLGQYLGRAFQLHDDLLDILGKPELTGKSNYTDIYNSKLTLIAHYTYQSSLPPDQKKLITIFEKSKKTKKDIAYVTQQYQASGALDLVKKDIAMYCQQAQALLQALALRNTEKQEIATIIQKLHPTTDAA